MSDSSSDTRTDADRTDRHAGADNTIQTDMIQWLSALVAILGLTIIATPFVYEATDTAVWNNTLVGTGIFALAAYNFYRTTRDQLAIVGLSGLVVLLGIWIAASPFLIEMGSDALETSSLVSGILVALIALFNAYMNSQAEMPARTQARMGER